MEHKTIHFEKYQGAGNDFIIIDGRREKINNPLRIAQMLCDRHFSIGADDVLYLERSDTATVRMRVLEPDGSESAMCGNGIRSVALYLLRKEKLEVVTIETISGLMRVLKKDSGFTVEMGSMQKLGKFISAESESIIEDMIIEDSRYFVVSSSEPHAVNFVDNVDKVDIGQAVSVAKNFA
ncbi:MAG: diaminopimelate epimerase, partial [Caldisericaceae bacterium]